MPKNRSQHSPYNDYYNAKIDAFDKELEKAKGDVLKAQSKKSKYTKRKADANRLFRDKN